MFNVSHISHGKKYGMTYIKGGNRRTIRTTLLYPSVVVVNPISLLGDSYRCEGGVGDSLSTLRVMMKLSKTLVERSENCPVVILGPEIEEKPTPYGIGSLFMMTGLRQGNR